ncbi:MAG: HU family DNA-binding protein [Aquificae bacterium]|nr:HU family DNA-binding protein [Aquificota bacterium]
MTKAELVAKIAEKAGITKKEADAAVKAFVEAIHELFKKEESLRIPGLGTFKVVVRKARKGRNPRTGQVINIPARKVLTFKPAKELVKEV